jgi:hypothetical protein
MHAEWLFVLRKESQNNSVSENNFDNAVAI